MATAAAVEARSRTQIAINEDLRVYGGLVREGDGIPPTVVEFQSACELSSTSVAIYHMRRMERAGYIYTPETIRARLRARYGDPFYGGARSKTLTPAGWERYRELVG